MSLDGVDLAFAHLLERSILREIHGDGDKHQGLFRGFLSAQNFEDVVRNKATIQAYETVLKMMVEIARDMNEPRRQAEGHMTRVN